MTAIGSYVFAQARLGAYAFPLALDWSRIFGCELRDWTIKKGSQTISTRGYVLVQERHSLYPANYPNRVVSDVQDLDCGVLGVLLRGNVWGK